MKILFSDDLLLAAHPLQLGGHPLLSVSATALFSLDGKAGPLLSSQEIPDTAEAALGEGEVLDQGFPKPRGEYLVYGAACSSYPVQGLQVRVRVGLREKILMVTGERCWTRGLMGLGISEAKPFTRLPLGWEQAFGGPDYAPNPLGKGRGAGAGDPLPLVQSPDRPMGSPSENAEPVGLRALGLLWPQRGRHLGSFGGDWLLHDWPHLPRGTDPEFFMSAPEDQRLTGFFRGDERVALEGMHPSQPVLQGLLPGIRARIFLRRLRDGETRLEEVESRAETLWLLPGQERGMLLFRGCAPIQDEDCEDIQVLAAWVEPLDGSPRDTAYYDERLQAELEGRPLPEPEAPPAPEEASGSEGLGATAVAAGAPVLAAAVPVGLAAMGSALSGDAASPSSSLPGPVPDSLPGPVPDPPPPDAPFLEPRLQELLRSYGIDPATLAPPTPEAEGSLEEAMARLQAQTQEAMDQAGLSEADLKAFMEAHQAPPALDGVPEEGLEEALEKLRQQTRQAMEQAGLDEGSLEALLKERTAAQPSMEQLLAQLGDLKVEDPRLAELLQESRKGLESLVAELGPEAMKPMGGLPEDFSLAALLAPGAAAAALDRPAMAEDEGSGAEEADAAGAAEAPPAPAPPPESPAAQLLDRLAKGGSLGDLPLEGADLSGLHLEGADFTGLSLEGTLFDGALLTGCCFAQARLKGASFKGASLRKARFQEASAPEACFQDALMEGADLSRSDLQGASFRQADLREADLRGASLPRADLEGLKAQGLRAGGADFGECKAQGADLRGAELENADFSEACLRAARMEGVQGKGMRFYGVQGQGLCLSGAMLEELRAGEDTDLSGADLSRARMSRSIWEGADLKGARFPEAVLEGADFTTAKLQGADFRSAVAREARFGRADLSGARMAGADLFGAELRRSRLVEADLKDANAYGADLHKAQLGRTRLEGANLGRTLLTVKP